MIEYNTSLLVIVIRLTYLSQFCLGTVLKRLIFISLFIFNSGFAQTIEVRAYVPSLTLTKQKLIELGAKSKSSYNFDDHIYKSSEINDEYIRVRKYNKTQWHQKLVSYTHKKILKFDKRAKTIGSKEFDSIVQAKEYLPKEFLFKYSFNRVGEEYTLSDCRLYLEDIQALKPSIEVLCNTKTEVYGMLAALSIKDTDIIRGSVPIIIETQL